MSSALHRWPFQSLTSLSPAQQAAWLERCYVRSQGDLLLSDQERSVVVIAPSGSGQSTSLTLLEQATYLTFKYTPEQWPGQPYALIKSPHHFDQFMAHVAQKSTDKLRAQPELLARCPRLTHEFLYWLVRRYLGNRRADVWLDHLQEHYPVDATLAMIERAKEKRFEDLYDGDSVNDIYGQIDEAKSLAHTLDWSGIYAIIDISMRDWFERAGEQRKALDRGLEQLFQSLTLIQRPQFGFKLAISDRLLTAEKAEELLRGRATVITVTWTGPELRLMAERLLAAATDNTLKLDHVTPLELWQALEPDIRSIWGQPCPAAIKAIIEHVLKLYEPGGWSTTADDLRRLREELYRCNARLRRDPTVPGKLWRAATDVQLDEAQQRVFDELWRSRGRPLSTIALLPLAGSNANLDKIVSRIRQAIEPLANSRIYLNRSTSQGVWLQPDSCVFD